MTNNELIPPSASKVCDKHGNAVYAFMGEISNLGFSHMGERIISMLESGVWQSWKDGTGRVELLPGEFDYFLSMCGVRPESVRGLNPDVLCDLDAHMDERGVTPPGEPSNGYRRRYLDVMNALAGRPHPVMPWVLTAQEKHEIRAQVETPDGSGLVSASAMHALEKLPRQTALGARLRSRRLTGDTRRRSEKRSLAEQLARKAAALSGPEYRRFQVRLKAERRKRLARRKATVKGS
jgi:hypothetical protein